MTTESKKPGAIFYIIGVLALIWNGLGVMAYLVRAFMTDEMIAQLPKEQQAEMMTVYPSWVTAAFAIAVFAGVLASIFLLMRKKFAFSLFVLSAVAAIAQHIYLFMNVEMTSVVMPIMVIVVCIFLVWYSKKNIGDGVLN